MNLSLSESQTLLLESTQRFSAERLAPFAKERENNHAISHDTIREMGNQGLLAVNLPGELGGSEAGVVAYALAVREVAKGDASVAVTMAVTNMVGEVLLKFGTPDQHREHIPKLASGEYFGGAFGLSEPGAGSDAGVLQAKAVQDGDDWVINGQKQWITTGDQAGVIVVWAL